MSKEYKNNLYNLSIKLKIRYKQLSTTSCITRKYNIKYVFLNNVIFCKLVNIIIKYKQSPGGNYLQPHLLAAGGQYGQILMSIVFSIMVTYYILKIMMTTIYFIHYKKGLYFSRV